MAYTWIKGDRKKGASINRMKPQNISQLGYEWQGCIWEDGHIVRIQTDLTKEAATKFARSGRFVRDEQERYGEPTRATQECTTATWKQIEDLYKKISDQIGGTEVSLLPPEQFLKLARPEEFAEFGSFAPGVWACASPEHRAITVMKNRPLTDIERRLWHELAHILFPDKPHWWVECFAAKMVPLQDDRWGGGWVGRYARQERRSPDELPSKEQLIELASEAVARLSPDDLVDVGNDDRYASTVSKPKKSRTASKPKKGISKTSAPSSGIMRLRH